MSESTRRQFLAGSTAALLFAPLGAAQANPIAPDPNDPSDPNRIVDPDGEIGKPYVGWREGDFDIHYIHTGWSECGFQIFPDGTTALVDSGEIDNNYERGPRACKLMPDESRTPSEWIVRYLQRLRPEMKTIDYVVASHFHRDHIGSPQYGHGMTTGRGADYQLSGIPYVGEFYHFGTAFDRDYPNYDRPSGEPPETRDNLLKFWDYKEREDGMKREAFEVGALDQIKPVVAPDKYDFHVRNIARNCVVWNGESGETIDYAKEWRAKGNYRNENALSIATVTSYGPFRFYTGGDACGTFKNDDGSSWNLDAAIGRAVGPVDVCKANHHSTKGSMTRAFTDEVRARVYIACVWCDGHLSDDTASSMCLDSETNEPRETLFCPTAVHSNSSAKLSEQPWRRRLVERGGHVVVKAYDGGARFKVYYLTAKDESMRVELVFGPFDSKVAKQS